MKEALKACIEVIQISWHDSSVGERLTLGSGSVMSPTLWTNHATAILGFLVGVFTLIAAVLRVLNSIEELRERKAKRRASEPEE